MRRPPACSDDRDDQQPADHHRDCEPRQSQGIQNLSPEARQLLELIEQHGGQRADELESAVHELEDTAAPPVARSAAKRRLLQFLKQVGSVAHDVAVEVLTGYVESKTRF